ncbi:hypothetical protein ACJX0J_016795 [Zea mays]
MAYDMLIYVARLGVHILNVRQLLSPCDEEMPIIWCQSFHLYDRCLMICFMPFGFLNVMLAALNILVHHVSILSFDSLDCRVVTTSVSPCIFDSEDLVNWIAL